MILLYDILFQLVSMKLRKPSVTASIWTNGKVTCTGSRRYDLLIHGKNLTELNLAIEQGIYAWWNSLYPGNVI